MPTVSTDSQQVKRPEPVYTVLAHADIDRPAWLEARKGLITAGEVPYVLGMYGDGARLRLWYEKAGFVERETADDFEGAQMGHRLEPLNAELFAERTGRELVRRQQLIQSKSYPWLGATLDYTQHVNPADKAGCPVELKSTGTRRNWPESEADIRFPDVEFVGEPSLRYQAQLQAQLICFGASWGSISVVLGSPFMHHRFGDFERHERFCSMILARTRAFWDSLQRGIPPEPDGSATAQRTLREAAARRAEAGKRRRLPKEALSWADELERARTEQRDAARRERLYEGAILTAMGAAERGDLSDGRAYQLVRTSRKGYKVAPSIAISLRKVDDQ
jgi:putative phage-type endonuclease